MQRLLADENANPRSHFTMAQYSETSVRMHETYVQGSLTTGVSPVFTAIILTRGQLGMLTVVPGKCVVPTDTVKNYMHINSLD